MKIEISVKVDGTNVEATLYVETLTIWVRREGTSEKIVLSCDHAHQLAYFMQKDPIGAILHMTKPHWESK
jgi:hypothetical protein